MDDSVVLGANDEHSTLRIIFRCRARLTPYELVEALNEGLSKPTRSRPQHKYFNSLAGENSTSAVEPTQRFMLSLRLFGHELFRTQCIKYEVLYVNKLDIGSVSNAQTLWPLNAV